MTFNTWILPLLDFYVHEHTIYFDYMRPNRRGTFSVTRQRDAQARLNVSVRYLYKVRNRIEALARIYEALVESGVIE